LKKIALILAFLPLAACDVRQVAEDQVRNEIAERADAAENDEHLNTLAPELSNQIDDVQNRVEDAQRRHDELQAQAGQLE
jgi:hypothetical protein